MGEIAVFWKREKVSEGMQKAYREATAIDSNTQGATRRATNMVPVASGQHEIAYTGTVKFHQLLISLEGNQRTGCLRIISPKRKSRSAILIYRGRVVGCLYGSRKMNSHCLQQDAHQHALSDLANPGNLLDAYELPEELVLAAASLFNGDVMRLDQRQSSEDMMDQALRSLTQTNLPGVAVASTIDEEMVCMIYVYGGKIIGIFSARDGWTKPSYEAAIASIKVGTPTKVVASYLAVRDLNNLGFSLTGLADSNAIRRQEMANQNQQAQAVDAFWQIHSNEATTYSNLPTPVVDKSTAKLKKPRWSQDAISAVSSHNVFAIAP
jgi:hypothetical protein